MKKKMKTKYIYVATTMYGDTEMVCWDDDGWLGGSSGRKYDESEFISWTKVRTNGSNDKEENEDE